MWYILGERIEAEWGAFWEKGLRQFFLSECTSLCLNPFSQNALTLYQSFLPECTPLLSQSFLSECISLSQSLLPECTLLCHDHFLPECTLLCINAVLPDVLLCLHASHLFSSLRWISLWRWRPPPACRGLKHLSSNPRVLVRSWRSSWKRFATVIVGTRRTAHPTVVATAHSAVESAGRSCANAVATVTNRSPVVILQIGLSHCFSSSFIF